MLPPQTPAEKAAALTREVRGEGGEGIELAEEGSPSGLVSWLRRGLVGLAIVVVLAAGAWATYDWSQRQYFVGEEEGRVAIFRGVSQDLGPVDLSEPETVTDIEVTALPTYYQQQVRSSLSADDLVGAEAIVAELRTLALPPCDELTVPLPGTDPDRVTVTIAPDGRTVTAGPDTTSGTAAPGDTDAATATQDRGPVAVPPTEDCRP
jgi:protein phosphatase